MLVRCVGFRWNPLFHVIDLNQEYSLWAVGVGVLDNSSLFSALPFPGFPDFTLACCVTTQLGRSLGTHAGFLPSQQVEYKSLHDHSKGLLFWRECERLTCEFDY